jgi:hypothetical protein
MSTFHVVGRPGFLSSRPTRPTLEEPAPIEAGTTQSGLASITVDRDREDENLDAVAGSEFVDDRIRLNE